jgi:hypothetical protein
MRFFLTWKDVLAKAEQMQREGHVRLTIAENGVVLLRSRYSWGDAHLDNLKCRPGDAMRFLERLEQKAWSYSSDQRVRLRIMQDREVRKQQGIFDLTLGQTEFGSPDGLDGRTLERMKKRATRKLEYLPVLCCPGCGYRYCEDCGKCHMGGCRYVKVMCLAALDKVMSRDNIPEDGSPVVGSASPLRKRRFVFW